MDYRIEKWSEMSRVRVSADTNTISCFFQGHPKAIVSLDDDDVFVSAITEIELLGFQGLNDCFFIEPNQSVKQKAIALKQAHKIKLPDAVIAATGQFLKIERLTFDKGFTNTPNLDLILLDY